MLTGWLKDDSSGDWYYLSPNGDMVSGVMELDGRIYYLGSPDSGRMETDTIRVNGRNYTFGENGEATDYKKPSAERTFQTVRNADGTLSVSETTSQKYYIDKDGDDDEMDRSLRRRRDRPDVFPVFDAGIYTGSWKKGHPDSFWDLRGSLPLHSGSDLCAVVPVIPDAARRASAQKMWDNQVLMLTYHESTVFDHPYSSEWYEWIWMKRPLLDAYTTLPDGKISVVATFGNPLIWWAGIPAFFFNLYQWQVKKDERTGYLCICYLTMLVPWLFIHRTVFIYQYFVCSIVLILLLGNPCRFLKHAKKAMTLYLVVTGIVFVCFYPVISGAPVDRSFSGQWLKWLSSWPLS